MEPASLHIPLQKTAVRISPLDVILPAFIFPLDLYLPHTHSFVFLVDDADAASRINKAIQELHHPAGVSKLLGSTGSIVSIAGLQ